MTDLPTLNERRYLGDGLFVSFDGWQIVLSAPRDDATHFVALEPSVWRALRKWIDDYPRLEYHMEG